MITPEKTFCSLFLVLLISFSSAWIPHVRLAAPCRQALRRRHCSALSSGRRNDDEEYLDDEDEAAAAAAAASGAAVEQARNTLERLWSSSGDSEESAVEQASEELPAGEQLQELVGEGEDGTGAEELKVRRENPFPTSAERGALEAAVAAQKALVAGKRGIILDIEVRQLDDTHPEFDADLLVFFATEVAKVLAAVSGRTRVMVRGDELAGLATETLRKSNMEGVEVGIDPRDDVSFCSMGTVDLQEIDFERDKELAIQAAADMGKEERLVMAICPMEPEMPGLREIAGVARGRPVVLLNPRTEFMPVEFTSFEAIYVLRQFNVQTIKTDPYAETGYPPVSEAQPMVFSEHGQVVPRILLARAYPDEFKLYLDIDGEGFRLEETFEENPEPMEICMIAQDIIQAAQEKVTMMQLRDEDPDADL